MNNGKGKQMPALRSDEEAEAFVDNADLSEYDLSGFKPVQFEFEKKSAQLNMRLPETLLSAIKAKARERGIPYTRLIREALEKTVAK
ncbi:BrnA antitoxin family protein [Rhizobium sp. PAMB 3182]